MFLSKFIYAYWFASSVVAVLVLAGALRFLGLGSVPNSLYWDEAAMAVDAQSIFQTGKDFHGLPGFSLILPSYGDYKLPMYVWLSVPFMGLPVGPELQIRLVSALAGMATVILSGLLTWELLIAKPKIIQVMTLAVMFVTAVLPWSIVFSHAGFEGHLGQVWVGLSVWLLLKLRRQPLLLWLSVLPGLAGIVTYYSVRFVWPVVMILSLLYIFWHHRQLLLASWKQYVLAVFLLFGIYATGIYGMTQARWYSESQIIRLTGESVLDDGSYVLKQNVERELSGNTKFSRVVFHRYWYQGKEILLRVFSHLSPGYLFYSGDSNLRHGTGLQGLAYLSMAPLLFLGGWWLWRRNPAAVMLLIGWWLTALLPASAKPEYPHALRSLNALLPFAILIGFGLGAFFTSRSKLYTGIGWLFVCIICLQTIFFMYIYTTVYPSLSASDWQAGYREVAQEMANVNDIRIYVGTIDDRFFLWYLLYGNIPFSQVHTAAKERQFEVLELGDRIKFAQHSDTFSADNPKPFLAIMRSTDIANTELSQEINTTVVKEITAGNTTYIVLLVK